MEIHNVVNVTRKRCEPDDIAALRARLAQFEALAMRAAEHWREACGTLICGTCQEISGELAALAEKTP